MDIPEDLEFDSSDVYSGSDMLRDAIANRIARGLSQEAIAELSGLGLEMVKAIESKGPGIEFVFFASYLRQCGLIVDYTFDGGSQIVEWD